MIEGVAALGLAFVLVVLLVQIGVAMAAREAAQAAVASSARRASRPGADLADQNTALHDILARTVPGARDITSNVRHHEDTTVATATIRVMPPGPDWIPLVIRVSARVTRVVPP